VVASLLRTLAFAMSALVVLGFAMFAVDQSSAASQRQEDKVQDITPTAAPAVQPAHTGLRRTIDNVDQALLSPFGTVGGDSAWLRHGVPAFLAFLLYGVGLGYLARWIDLRA